VTATAAELSRVTKRFGARVALDDISFSIGEGEVVALLGPKGVVRLVLGAWRRGSCRRAQHPLGSRGAGGRL
jgi:ABC-2 type transport system ATP-binding protein